MPRIEEPLRVRLGDCEQFVLLRGDADSGRVLLYLHGGPGMPSLALADRIARATRLERDHVVAWWEQRATGKSLASRPDPASLTIERHVLDAIDLCERLAARFEVERVHLMGHSWGSVIGVLVAARRPDLIASYTGVGQVADFLDGELTGYRFALAEAARRRDRRALRELERIGPPPWDARTTMAERKWIIRFGANLHERPQGVLAATLEIALCRHYTMGDLWRILRRPLFAMERLLPELYEVDLFRDTPRLEVPVLVLGGRHDFTVPSTLAWNWLQALDAPAGKRFEWFERSAHFPFIEEPARFDAVLARFRAEAEAAPAG